MQWAIEGYVKEIKGDLLSSDVTIRCHQVNCRGAMGAGIAKQVKEKYPEAYQQYRALCDQFGSSLLGHTQFIACHDGTVIANLFAQDDFDTSKPQTSIGALRSCLEKVADFAFRTGGAVGFPKYIGCGLAGGDWEEVTALIAEFFDFKGGGCTIVEWDPSAAVSDPEPAKPVVKPSKSGKKTEVTIHTDGSCLYNPGPGGWAAILLSKDKDGKPIAKELSGGTSETTNNRMELQAVIAALYALKCPCHGTLYTDSSYVANSINQGWMAGWKKNGWTKKGGLQNADLWKRVDELLAPHEIKFVWVKGHANNPYNERCDEIARKEATKRKR